MEKEMAKELAEYERKVSSILKFSIMWKCNLQLFISTHDISHKYTTYHTTNHTNYHTTYHTTHDSSHPLSHSLLYNLSHPFNQVREEEERQRLEDALKAEAERRLLDAEERKRIIALARHLWNKGVRVRYGVIGCSLLKHNLILLPCMHLHKFKVNILWLLFSP